MADKAAGQWQLTKQSLSGDLRIAVQLSLRRGLHTHIVPQGRLITQTITIRPHPALIRNPLDHRSAAQNPVTILLSNGNELRRHVPVSNHVHLKGQDQARLRALLPLSQHELDQHILPQV